MEYPLHFNGQTWKLRREGELTLFLPTHPRFGTSFHLEFDFVPSWFDCEDDDSEHRKMQVAAHGYFPELKKWDELPGCEVMAREAVEVGGEVVSPSMEGPEIEIWSHGEGAGSIHTHAQHGWETRLKMEDFAGDSSHSFVCELEAFFPSERARALSSELYVKEFFGELDADDREKAKLLEEGWRFQYRGIVELENFSCTVPLNTNDPVGWAKKMVEREMGMDRFGWCRVNGGDFDGNYKPEDGIVAHGRLVLISPPSIWFTARKRRLEEERRKRNEGQAGK